MLNHDLPHPPQTYTNWTLVTLCVRVYGPPPHPHFHPTAISTKSPQMSNPTPTISPGKSHSISFIVPLLAKGVTALNNTTPYKAATSFSARSTFVSFFCVRFWDSVTVWIWVGFHPLKKDVDKKCLSSWYLKVLGWTLFAITLKLKILRCNNPISHNQDLEWEKIILFWLFWSLGSTQCQVQQGQSIKKHLSLRVQYKIQSSYMYLSNSYTHFFKLVTCICQYIKKHLSLWVQHKIRLGAPGLL